jgi:NAD(P)H-dependent FMN reductase
MIHGSDVLVIGGSVRPRRICLQLAAWVAEVGREVAPWRLEVVDLKAWPLPMDDEPDLPARGAAYANVHTQAWSRKIAGAAGFVFVTPQYNWGYPAPLKNALDHLFHEWSGKPALIVTYGGHGGVRCAAQLRQVLEGLDLRPVATTPAFKLERSRIEADPGEIEAATELAGHLEELRRGLVELAQALVEADQNAWTPPKA